MIDGLNLKPADLIAQWRRIHQSDYGFHDMNKFVSRKTLIKCNLQLLFSIGDSMQTTYWLKWADKRPRRLWHSTLGLVIFVIGLEFFFY